MKKIKKSKSILQNNLKSLGQLYKVRKKKSLEGTKIQQEKLNQWLIEDKNFLKLNISISSSLDKFVSGDFELADVNNLKELSQSIK